MLLFTKSVRIKFSVSTAAVVVLMGSPVAADWQYTRWGDSPEEVLSAADGAAKPNDDRGRDPLPNRALLTAQYEAFGFRFNAYFVFDPADQLVYVDLEPQKPDECNAIRLAVTSAGH